MCVLDADGATRQVEAQGEVYVGGRPVLKATGHLAAIALDGKPLAESEALLLLPFAPCEVTLTSRLAGPVAECGEVSGGLWRTLRRDLPVKAEGGAVQMSCGKDLRLEMVIVATPEQLEAARERVAAMLAG